MNNLTDNDYWDKVWASSKSDERNRHNKKDNNRIIFGDLFDKYLVWNTDYKCIEIGCAPGRFLVYLNKRFGYKIYGIDFADRKLTEETFVDNGIEEYTIYQADFNYFKTDIRFDVVCSFGFIEHFIDYETIFNKHVALLKDGGILIMELPNFRYIQHFLHRLLDKENLERHNIEIMDLAILERLAKKENLRIIELNYYETARFWAGNAKSNKLQRGITFFLSAIFRLINKLIKLPNKYLSPYIVLICQKPVVSMK